jgi:dTDP-4-dehydrorhamnose 3,5-epimerase
MKFTETSLKGAYIIELEPHQDDRGFFARTWCQREFLEHGLNPRVVQCNSSYNKQQGTFRGMHFQDQPHQEAKLVRVTRGAVMDIIVDLRRGSPTYLRNYSVRLDAENRKQLYIPEEFAHGFLTLEDDTEIFYQMSEFYAPESARGVRWNDPALALRLPGAIRVIAEHDLRYPDWK